MLGIIALALVLVTIFVWFRLIQRVAVPRNRAPYLACFVGFGLLGLVAVARGGMLSTITGSAAALIGLGFAALRLQSAQKPNRPAVVVGDAMLVASAPDEHGVDFDLASLTGKPYLLKFFRGHW